MWFSSSPLTGDSCSAAVVEVPLPTCATLVARLSAPRRVSAQTARAWSRNRWQTDWLWCSLLYCYSGLRDWRPSHRIPW